MTSPDRNRQMSMLARASRVAGHHGRFRARTHYLTADELRTVPVTRLLRETAWADRPDASDQWRDERRAVVADEFARRGFEAAAADIWHRWEPADYDGQIILSQQLDESERREHDAQRSRSQTPDREIDRQQEMTVLWAVSAMVTAGAATDLVDGDEVMERVTAALDRAWEGTETDPAIGGELDMNTGADLADSLTAVAEPDVALTAEPDVAIPDVTTEIEV